MPRTSRPALSPSRCHRVVRRSPPEGSPSRVCPATLRGRRSFEVLTAASERGFSRVAFLAPPLRPDFVSPPSYGLTIRCWADREIRRSAGCFHFCHARPRSVEFAIWAMAVRGLCHGNSIKHAWRAEARDASCHSNGILPLCSGFGSEDPKGGSRDEVALKVEGVVDRTMHVEEALGGSS
jgi:hypothetical protein